MKDFITKRPLVAITCVLCFISCFAILNAAPIIQKIANPSMLWSKQLIFYTISAIMIYFINKIGNDQIYDNIWLIYWILVVLLGLLVVDHYVYPLIGGRHIVPLAHRAGGATSWYNLKVLSLQPSEFMKIALVILLSKITKEYNEYTLVPTLESEIAYVAKCMGIVILPAALVYLQNDTGVVLIILMGVLFVFFGSGIRDKWFIIGICAIVLVVGLGIYIYVFQHDIFATIFTGHKLDRFYGWLDPEGTVKKQGYQLFYSLLSYGTAGWFGHGFQQVVKVFPEAQTDFIFAVILTDYGFIGGLITLGAIVLLDMIILNIGFESSNDRDKYFTMGIFGMLIFQQVWNIAMILGLLPITGITLPFISYGGSSLISYMIAIGMFIDIDDQNRILKNRHILTKGL